VNAKRKKFNWKLAICVFSFVFSGVLYFDAVLEPQRAHGYALFRSRYALARDKNSMLKSYDANLVNHNAGYIPEQVDKFLCSKLQSSTSVEEASAIVDFYAFKAGAREGRFIYSLPAQTKERVVDLLLKRLNHYDANEAESAIILIEVLRRGKYLGKASVVSTGRAVNYETWWPQQGLPQAKRSLHKWWSSYPTWQEKEKHDPLKDSSLQVVAP